MKKLNSKIYLIIIVFFITNVYVQTDVLANNQIIEMENPTIVKEVESNTIESSINENENTMNDTRLQSPVLPEVADGSEGTEANENEVGELLTVEVPTVEIENSVLEDAELGLNSDKENNGEPLESIDSLDETSEEELQQDESATFDENAEEVSEETFIEDEETIIIDEEEFDPIIGLPTVKEEVEIEYEKDSKVELELVEKKVLPAVQSKNSEETPTLSADLQQTSEMTTLPQTGGSTSDFSKLGFVLLIISVLLLTIGRKRQKAI